MQVIILYLTGLFLSYNIPVNAPKVVLCTLSFQLSPEIEVPLELSEAKIANPVSLFLGLHKSKMIVVKLSALFMLDSFGGSFVLQSIMSAWFHKKYVLSD